MLNEEEMEQVRNIVRDILVRELQSRYIPARSVLPTKITPAQQDGTRPVDQSKLGYDADTDTVTFLGP